MSPQDADVSWNTVTSSDFHQIADCELFGFDGYSLAIANDKCKLRDEIFEGFHDFVTFPFLKVREDARHYYDDRQYNTQVQLEIENERITKLE
jgi:hypothetical protein